MKVNLFAKKTKARKTIFCKKKITKNKAKMNIPLRMITRIVFDYDIVVLKFDNEDFSKKVVNLLFVLNDSDKSENMITI